MSKSGLRYSEFVENGNGLFVPPSATMRKSEAPQASPPERPTKLTVREFDALMGAVETLKQHGVLTDDDIDSLSVGDLWEVVYLQFLPPRERSRVSKWRPTMRKSRMSETPDDYLDRVLGPGTRGSRRAAAGGTNPDGTPPPPGDPPANPGGPRPEARSTPPRTITCLEDALTVAEENWRNNPNLRAEFSVCGERARECYLAWVKHEWRRGENRHA